MYLIYTIDNFLFLTNALTQLAGRQQEHLACKKVTDKVLAG